jgi:hypothetical protein
VSTTSDSGLADEVMVELNPPGPEPDYGPQPAAIPDRPADGASKDAWIEYVVALGADRTFVTSDTEHFAGEGYKTEPGLSRPQLIQLADRLGG